MSQPPTPGDSLPPGGTGPWLNLVPRQAAPLSAQSSFDSIHGSKADSMMLELPTAVPTPTPPYPAPVSSSVSLAEPPTAVPAPLPHLTTNSGSTKRKRKTNSNTPGTTESTSNRNAIREQNLEARLSALERIADACEAPPPTMRAPPPPTLKSHASDARDIWYWQYPIKSKPILLLTQSEIDDLIPKIKKYQADLVFDQIQHPNLESEALLCACCLFDGMTKVFLNREAGITGGIREHMKKAHPVEYYTKCMQEGLIERCKDMSIDALRGGQPKFTLDGFLDRLVRWIAVDDQSFNLVEVPEFRDVILYAAQGRIQDSDLPHRDKLETLAYAMYRLEKNAIDKEMKSSRGVISLTSDLWSDIRIRSFMSVTAHYINELGILRDHLIAFRKLDGHHTGINIAHALHDVLQESDIVEKLGFITLDNATNNNSSMVTLAEILKPHGVSFDPERNRLRCFPHILNLAVQTIIKSLGASAIKYRAAVDRSNLAISPATEAYLQALESNPVDACRASVAACRSSGTRREKFLSVIKTGNAQGRFQLPDGRVIQLDILELLRDAVTRWGSTYMMMDRYEKMYPAVREFAVQMRHEAAIPILTHKQYEVMQDLLSVLRIPYNAQELLSSEKTPTLALALPLFDTITWSWEQLAVAIPELCQAITCGILKLQEYRGLLQDIPVHTLAMFLNPAIKLSWVHDHGSKLEVEEAEEIILEEMLKIQRTRPPPPSAYSTLSARRATQAQSSGYLRVLTAGVNLRRASDLQNTSPPVTTAALPFVTSASQTQSVAAQAPWPSAYEVEQRNRQIVQDEYQLYLNEALIDTGHMSTLDLVQYWVDHQYTYPNLYQIAMNVLPTQASSVSSERVFSSSKLTITAQRSRLSASNVEYLQVLKHALRLRRRDLVDGVNANSGDGLDFISHLLEDMTIVEEDSVN